jgi:phosphate acetyltransferase
MDPDALKKLAESPLIQAGNLLYEDHADCVVAGCVATTADVIRAAISTVGLAPGIRTVSGSFLMDRSDVNVEETFVFADCGVVIDPSTEQLVDIAKSSADTLQKLTHKAPVVAFLSFSTKQSADHPAADKVRSAARLFQQKYPTIESDGELQFDSAIIPAVGAKKAPGSRVPGRANCFIFPNLDAGNIAYKITQRLAGFGAYGPILQGLSKPYSDLSRGASPEDIAISAIINILRSR